MHPFISFQKVSKKYRELLALDHISFEIDEGEIFGYIGPNGAGKTTTIKILVNLIRDFQGAYFLKNNKMPQHAAQVSRMLGYLPQGVSFQEWRTVDMALKTFGRLSGLTNDKIEERIKSLLELFDLSDVRFKKIAKLSGGMIQKVGLVQALLHDPKFLVLDEPLAGLDPAGRYELKSILKDLSKKGTTIFFSSHILSDVQDIADRIAIIKNGHILRSGTIENLKKELSPASTVEFHLASDFENINELKTISGIKELKQPSDRTIIIQIKDDTDVDEVSNQILKYFINKQIKIRKFARLEPDLDEVYLQYINES